MKMIKQVIVIVTIWCFFFGNLASVHASSSQTSNTISNQMTQAVENGFSQPNANSGNYKLLQQSISDEFNQPIAIPDSNKLIQQPAGSLIQVAVAGQAVACHCYCGVNIPAPCGDEQCKSACGYQEPSQYSASNDRALLILAAGIALVAVVALVAGLQGQAIFPAYPKFSMTPYKGVRFKF